MEGRVLLVLLLSIGLAPVKGACPIPHTTVGLFARDNKTIAADYYLPSESGTFPTILIQTPYNRKRFYFGLPLSVACDLASSQYAFFILDWRGFYESAGAAVANYDRGKDGYDAIEWITQQPWSNGKVATWGISALGQIQYQTAQENHPALKCIMPMSSTMTTQYLDHFPGGTARVEYFEQLDGLGYGVSGVYYDNPYYNTLWAVTESLTTYPADIKVPALLIGGWHDHQTTAMLRLFQQLRNSGTSVAGQHRIIFGPWSHSTFGDAVVGNMTFPEAAGYDNDRMVEWLDWCLLGNNDSPAQSHPLFTYFQMGENTWNNATAWPPAAATPTTVYLAGNGADSRTTLPEPSSYSSFTYAPADPSPTIGGATLSASLLQGPYDQSAQVESRHDNLIFSTPLFTSPMRMQGELAVNLNVKSSAVDTDLVVRLTDVYPDGTSMLLTEAPMRLRNRLGTYRAAHVALLTPGTFYSINFTLPSIAHTFLAGHRLRVILSSSNYPRFNRNSNNGLDPMYPGGSGSTLVTPVINATNTIALDGTSFITIPVHGDFNVEPPTTPTPTPSQSQPSETPPPSTSPPSTSPPSTSPPSTAPPSTAPPSTSTPPVTGTPPQGTVTPTQPSSGTKMGASVCMVAVLAVLQCMIFSVI